MNTSRIFSLLLIASVTVLSCKQQKAVKGSVEEKKAALQQLMEQQAKTDEEIRKIQNEISMMSGEQDANAKLIAVAAVAVQKFDHFIDLRGKIDAENISYITPRGMGGQVKQILVKEGDHVRKGQLLLKLDDAIMKQSLNAARQQLEGIKTQLAYAKNIYDRQNNLWEKGIGTEVQLISAKTNVDALQNQLKAAEEQVKVGVEQLSTAEVRSDVDGVAETVMVKVGELFGGMGQIKIVNTGSLKVTASISETYVNKVKKGTPVIINIPDLNKKIPSVISLIGQTIENAQRGFVAEAKIPSDPSLKPNQSCMVKILDYTSAQAVVIPVNTIQSDETGKYVYVMEKQANGKNIATRKTIVLGEVYGEQAEIRSGLNGGEQLITAGYQNLYEGQAVVTSVK